MAERTRSAALGGDVLIYGLGNVVVAALNFGLFAVFARHLAPADYGAMSLIVTVSSAVSMFGMMGMNNAVQRFFFDDPSDAVQRRVWGSGFLGGLGMTVTFAVAATVLAFVFLSRSQPALGGNASLIAFATVLPQTVVVWLQDRARLQFRARYCVLLALGQVSVGGVAGTFFVVHCGGGLAGFFLGTAVGAVITAVFGLLTTPALRPLVYSRCEFLRLLRFGAPFVPAGLAMWASTTVLRWELAHFKDLDAVGVFDVAWKFAAPVWLLNAAVGQAFGPYAFRLRAEDPDYRSKLIQLLHILGGLALTVSCALAVFAQELCALVAPAAYAGAAVPCAVLSFAFYFSSLHQVAALGIAFAEQPRLIAYGWCGAALMGALAGLALVPVAGAAGTAWSLVLVYAGLTLFYVRCTQRLHPLPFQLGPLVIQITVGLASVGVAAFADGHPISGLGVSMKLACLAGLTGAVIAWGGIDVARVRTTVVNFLSTRRVRQ